MGMSHVIPELMDRARKVEDGGSIEVFSVDHRRTFCYVDDAVELMVRAADADAARGAVLNVGQQAPEITIGELAATVIAVVGKRLQIKPGPVTAGSPPRRAPDTSRIRDATGFTPRIDLREGVRRTWAWYEARVFRGGGPSAL
jgi:nucleoside-diphosphate-sugar epimerase